MATTAIATELLVLNTRGNDNPDGADGSAGSQGIVATTPTDGWVVSPPSGLAFDDRLFFRLVADGTGDTVVFTGGDRYPAQRADLGNMSVVLAASDVRMIAVETSRFLQDNGTIVVTCTDAGTRLQAYMLPRAC
jgi:hypothetical protein